MGVEGERSGDAAAECALDHEVERADVRHFVAGDRARRDRHEMGGDTFGGDSLDQKPVVGSKAITEMLEVSPLSPVRECAICRSFMGVRSPRWSRRFALPPLG